MLIVLSPAKSLDNSPPPKATPHTQPDFLPRASELIELMRTYSPAQIGSLMSISDNLAQLNAERYASWSPEFNLENAKQAALAFDGDVYGGLDARSMTSAQLNYTQDHVRILSGLYGVLRPLDLMQPYRLEMGTRLANGRGKDLYAFWGDTVTEALNAELTLQPNPVLVNLASEEYFKVVRPKSLEAQIITPVFEEWKNGRYKIISFFAKRARGLMARYAAQKRLKSVDKLKLFDLEGYCFEPALSDSVSWRFRRRVAD
jgi:uncharacterized protein